MLSIGKNLRLGRISRLTSIETTRLKTYPRMIVTGQGPTAYWIKFSFEIEKYVVSIPRWDIHRPSRNECAPTHDPPKMSVYTSSSKKQCADRDTFNVRKLLYMETTVHRLNFVWSYVG